MDEHGLRPCTGAGVLLPLEIESNLLVPSNVAQVSRRIILFCIEDLLGVCPPQERPVKRSSVLSSAFVSSTQ